MDRPFVYPGQIPLETDILNTNRNALVALAKLSAAVFGTGNTVNGLTVSPTSPASLQVNVAPGELYALQNLDSTAYSSLAADTAHQVIKQGISLNTVTLNCPAPGTTGQSINYLIQATYADVDGSPVALPYYNASNPSVAWSGPNNSGTQQNTVRAGAITLSAKAGVAAATGSQATPSADAGYVALYAVTVSGGQTQITASNVFRLFSAPYLPAQGIVGNMRAAGTQLFGSASLTVAQSGTLIEMVANGGTATLPTPSAAVQGVIYYLSAPSSVSMTVATTSGVFNGGGLQFVTSFVLAPSMTATVTCDGVNWIVLSISNGGSLPSANGYQRLSSGLLIQWGAASLGGTSGTFNFPVAFSSAVYSVTGSDGGTGAHSMSFVPQSVSQFTAYTNPANTLFNYIAIGV